MSSIGAFLRTSIDSSSLTTLMSEVGNSKIKTFSNSLKEETFNELGCAKAGVDRFQTDHREFVLVSNPVRNLVPKLTELKARNRTVGE